VWTAHHLNTVPVRCPICARLTDLSQASGSCGCRQALPPVPESWRGARTTSPGGQANGGAAQTLQHKTRLITRKDLAAAPGARRDRRRPARRQYQLAEPENRLVVRQLETDWEAALAEPEKLGEEYDRINAARPRTLTAPNGTGSAR
jgi:hypothetical protein